MARYGYTLYCEGNHPKDLIKQAVMAEDAGFDFLVISDHFHPWLPNQKNSGFAWSILGAVAQATKKIELSTMVTCPIMRYHPAIVAQMAATMAVISDDRFTLGLGAGERLNEHVVGEGWPMAKERHLMLREAIEIIIDLWGGGYVTYHGDYYRIDDAKIFDLPDKLINTFLAAGGPDAAALAAELTDGLCMTEPDDELVRIYKEVEGDADNIWGQVVIGWDPDEKTALQHVYDQFRFAVGGWKVQSELPNPAHFAAATKNVKPHDMASLIPAGPDAKKHLDAIDKYLDIGVVNMAVAYPGDKPESFMEFWAKDLRPSLR
jgi:G6PDH family F420-dependent oxidoreductase